MTAPKAARSPFDHTDAHGMLISCGDIQVAVDAMRTLLVDAATERDELIDRLKTATDRGDLLRDALADARNHLGDSAAANRAARVLAADTEGRLSPRHTDAMGVPQFCDDAQAECEALRADQHAGSGEPLATLADFTRRLANELHQLAPSGCWCQGRTDRCVDPQCRWRRELIAEARAALAAPPVPAALGGPDPAWLADEELADTFRTTARAAMREEAAASVALDHDERAQTFTVDPEVAGD